MSKFFWSQRTNFGPSPRFGASTTFDSIRNRTVLFGGVSAANAPLGDTWEWDGALWTQIEDIGPVPRSLAAMAFDSSRKASLLFGGLGATTTALGDTWQWDGDVWTQVSESGPSARHGHAMAFDSNRNRTVLFGGGLISNPVLGDTWEFDGDVWTQQQDTGPSPRAGQSMAYDPVSQRVLLLGGADSTERGLADTWSWDGRQWARLSDFGPPGRLSASLASTQDGHLLLFGGVNTVLTQPTLFGDTWDFDGSRWTQLQDIGPGGLRSASLVFDSARTRLVLFGGLPVPFVAAGTPAPASGLTWEAPAATHPLVGIASLQLPVNVAAQAPALLTIHLSAPAPASGVTIQFTGPALGLDHQPLQTFRVTGTSVTSVQILFPQAGESTITAQIANTFPVSITVIVIA